MTKGEEEKDDGCQSQVDRQLLAKLTNAAFFVLYVTEQRREQNNKN